ncbi:dethiobiotin synthase [Parabacteroides timonensis]|uniref:dethiobiotin synthase n=1 Tax=Parabacteroides timonensis TaxID=1871013 RepID=UPI00094E42EE|nr:dethiobiotin synthase [Parabacteroides timonensis]
MKGKVLFISGIDTNVGKTYATGILARQLAAEGHTVITQKMIQTGCTDISEDIEMHRQLMGIPFTEEDKAGLTCPYIFTYPCSPHMAAERDGRRIELDTITRATNELQERYEYVLLEGAGGLMVPNNFESLTIDYVREQQYPLILVTSGKLGSINHTLLSLYACRQQGIQVHSVIYNLYPHTDQLIEDNTLAYLRQYIRREWPDTHLLLLPKAGPSPSNSSMVIPAEWHRQPTVAR